MHHFTGMDFQQTKLIPRAFTKLKLRLGLKSPVVIKDLCNIQRFPARGAAAQSAGSLAVFGSSLALPGWRWGRRGARGGQGDGRPAAVLAHSRAAEGRLGPRTRRRPPQPPSALAARAPGSPSPSSGGSRSPECRGPAPGIQAGDRAAGGRMEPQQEPGWAVVRQVHEEAGIKGKLRTRLGRFGRTKTPTSNPFLPFKNRMLLKIERCHTTGKPGPWF